MLNTSDFKKLRSWGWRNRGIRQKRGPVRTLHAQGTGFVNLKYEPTFETGCWRHDGRRHHIIIGGKFTDALTSASRSNPAHVRDASQSLLRHECWHGLATTELKEIAETLRADGIPFRLFNLFEDARIEHLARNDSGTLDESGKFRWANWLEIPEVYTTAIGWFHLLVAREGSSFKNLTSAEAGFSWAGAANLPDGRETKRVIRKFYTEATQDSRCSRDLLPLIKRWIKIFGLDTSKGLLSSPEIDGKSDEGERHEKENTPSDELKQQHTFDAKVAESNLTSGECDDLENQWGRGIRLNWDEPKVRRIVNRLTQITASAAVDRDELGSRGSRIHLPGIIAQSGQFIRCTTEVSGKRTITVIVDCSSSMRLTWQHHGGLEFVIALARLHRRGILDVRCWLTGNRRCWRVPFHRISDRDIARIEPRLGRESFAYTLRTAAKDIAASDATIAWTDGMITDGDVDSRELRRRGVDIIGCAPRDPSETKIRANMIHHFGRGFVGEAEVLARHIAHYILGRD